MELPLILGKLKALRAKAYITIKGTPYTIVLDGFISVENGSGSKVNWSLAFGSRSPIEVLNTAIKIEVELKDRVLTFNSIKELMQWARSNTH
ncbi:MAG: hypothetical protein QXK12_03595 [Candidatus Nezhaarchaeales archaeon]